MFSKSLRHRINAVGDIKHVEDDEVEDIHLQLKLKGIQHIALQRCAGFKGPDDIHHRAGNR
ncbi:hypothetical protein ExPCM14_04081 [Escherichia coli]|nr:hypothetical protein ExPCM14_04081 [Escherichia coli]